MALIYRIIFTTSRAELLLPDLASVIVLLKDETELLEMLILKKIDIITENVDKESERYKIAVKNGMITNA